MQQSRRHPHRHLDQGPDRDPEIRGPLHPDRPRPLARRDESRIRGGPDPAQSLASGGLFGGPAHPHRPLEDQGRAAGRAGGLHLAHPAQGRNPHQALGELPRRFALRAVGLHRAGALRLRRGHGDRLLRQDLLLLDRKDRRPLPRMDVGRRRPLPAQIRPLRGHGVHHARHGHGPLHRREPPAALQRPREVQRRRTGPPVQRHGQALDREDRRGEPRRLPHRERHHGQRMQVSPGPRTGRYHAQRFRERLRMDRRGVLRQARRGPQGPDRRSRGVPGMQVRLRSR